MKTRVLHVVEASACIAPSPVSRRLGSDQPVLRCAALIASENDAEHGVLLLGDASAARHAAFLGLWADAWYSPPLGAPELAWRAVGRAVRDLGPFDLLQPWSDGARRACRASGWSRRAIAPMPDQLGPALLDCPLEQRAAIRASLGVPDRVPLVGLLADPPWLADARRFVYMIGLLDVAGIAVSGVADPRTAYLARARRFHSEAAVSWRLLTPDAPLTRVLPGCDLAVLVPPTPHRAPSPTERAWTRWSVTSAHAMGIPVIAGSEWFEGVPSPESVICELRAGDGALTDIARQLALLAESPERRESIGHELRIGTRWTPESSAVRRDWAGLRGPDPKAPGPTRLAGTA